MSDIRKLLKDYNITQSDIEAVKSASETLERHKGSLIEYHYAKLISVDETARFLSEERVLKRAKEAFSDWYTDLISGEYNATYYAKLSKIGVTHQRIGLPQNWVNMQMSNVRSFMMEAVYEDYKADPEMASSVVTALNKVLDMNLDMMTRIYREEEHKTHFLSRGLDDTIIYVAKRLVNGFNIVLVVSLLLIGILTLGLTVKEFADIIADGFEHTTLSALGSILMLWVVIELLDTQISHMKGHSFAIKVFVSVALVAELRKVLMASIEHSTWMDHMMLAATILILGIVYWLISKVERRI